MHLLSSEEFCLVLYCYDNKTCINKNKLRAEATAHLHVLGGLGFEKDGEPGKSYIAWQEVGWGEEGR